MNRLRQFQKSCQSFQGVLFTGVRTFSLQIYRIVFDCFNRVPLALQRWLSSAITRRLVLRKPPTLKLPLQASIRSAPIWRMLNELRCQLISNNQTLQWVPFLTICLIRRVFMLALRLWTVSNPHCLIAVWLWVLKQLIFTKCLV